MERLERRKPGWPGGLRRSLERQRSQTLTRSRGQALVEFALIAPLFLLLLFGVVEYSLINASIGAFNFAAKEAARYDAIAGNGASPSSTTPLDQWVVNNIIVPHVAGLVMAQMQEVIVFKADETGHCYTAGTGVNGNPPCATTTENVLTYSGGTWTITQNGWPPQGRSTQLSNADYLGVEILYTYTYLTAFFATTSPTLNLSATSVQRIEPQQYGNHAKPSQIASVESTPLLGSLPLSDALILLSPVMVTPRRNRFTLARKRI